MESLETLFYIFKQCVHCMEYFYGLLRSLRSLTMTVRVNITSQVITVSLTMTKRGVIARFCDSLKSWQSNGIIKIQPRHCERLKASWQSMCKIKVA